MMGSVEARKEGRRERFGNPRLEKALATDIFENDHLSVPPTMFHIESTGVRGASLDTDCGDDGSGSNSGRGLRVTVRSRHGRSRRVSSSAF
jgi:hypothetical protein